MNSQKYLPQIVRAVGASYLFQQTASCERVGGVEVSVRVRLPEELTSQTTPTAPNHIQIVPTVYGSDEPWQEDSNIEQTAVDGIIDYAHEQNIDLIRLEIKVGNFLFHPVDSRPSVYYAAAQNAFEAAIKTIGKRKLVRKT